MKNFHRKSKGKVIDSQDEDVKNIHDCKEIGNLNLIFMLRSNHHLMFFYFNVALGLEEGKECIVVGTLYKHMKLKPTILNDYLVLEDESGRVNLKGSVLSPSIYITGNIVALHGKETSGGNFLVEDILEAGLPPQLDLPSKSGEDKYVVLVSGLNVGSSSSNPLQLQLLVDHITSHLADEKVPKNLASKDQSKLSGPIKELEIFLTQIAAGILIDNMSGYNDPANFALPQQDVTPSSIGILSSLRVVPMFTLLVIKTNMPLAFSRDSSL
ncbi:hypothetical protein L1887_17105 [Cichorium endivia]|nr:hypothetical protein L1887_17105 [Cichorium endivia]